MNTKKYDPSQFSLIKIHPEFEKIYRAVHNVSSICAPRLISLYHTILKANELPGVNAECGVFNGGSAYMILAASLKELFLFDSFNGVPELDDNDLIDTPKIKKGAFASNINDVKEFLDPYQDRLTIYEGWFSDTLHTQPEREYSLVHLDVDLYQSYKECLEYFVPRIVSGGFLVCDEYVFHNLPGAHKAINEYFGDVESLEHWHQDIQLTVRF